MNPKELEELAKSAGLELLALVNLKSAVYKKSGLDASSMTAKEIAEMLSDQPRIMIRPLLGDGKNLTRGFKAEEMEKLL